MNSYKICAKTVMDSTDPSITFDENGISNHFYDFKDLLDFLENPKNSKNPGFLDS